MSIGTLTEQLQEQNNTLLRLNSNLSDLSGSIATMVRNQTDEARRRREAEDDARRAAGGGDAAGSASGGSSGSGGGGSGAGTFGGLGGMGTFGVGAATAGILKTFGGIAKRGILAGAMNAAAGVTADFVETQTGSVELGDATHRAMKLGSFGLLFGKRFGAIAGLAGALATDENIDKLKQIGDKLGPLKDVAVKAFEKLPSMSEVLEKATNGFGGALDMMNSALSGDLSGMGEASYDTAVLAAGLGNKRNKQAVGGGVKAVGRGARAAAIAAKNKVKPPVVSADFSKAERLRFNSETLKTVSFDKANKLRQAGYTVNQTTGAISKGGKFVGADEMDDAFKKAGIKTSGQSASAKDAIKALNEKAASKFSRFGKLLSIGKSIGKRVPILGTLLTGGMMGATLMNEDLSREEKIAELAKQFGGIGGATLGGIIGGMAGSVVPGMGNLVGGLIGAFGGAVAGEKLAFEAAKMLLGEDSEIVEAAKRMEGGGDLGAAGGAGGGAGGGTSAGGTTTAPLPTTAVKVTEAANTSNALQSQPPVVIMDNSNNSTNVSGGGGGGNFSVAGSISVFDTYDPYLMTRR